MRVLLIVTAVLLAGCGGVAFAQSANEGPLAAPGAAPAVESTKAKTAHRKSTKTARRAPAASGSGAGFGAGVPAAAQPVAHASGDTPPADPLSFGMKWNGSNDNAAQTRAQNYDGSAPGTGAEVGMKLHF